jgi:hypothetical protein
VIDQEQDHNLRGLRRKVSDKLESIRLSNWQREKPKPTYPRFRRRWQHLSNSRGFPVLALFVLAFTAITLYVLVVRPFGREPEHDLSKAAKEYNDFLASPAQQALRYPAEDDPKRANAAIIALVRNSELTQMMQSMRELEETFNRKFKYPWIFFNDEPFDDKFKRITSSLTDAETRYGTKFQSVLMIRGDSERALGRSDLDSPRYDGGVIQ